MTRYMEKVLARMLPPANGQGTPFPPERAREPKSAASMPMDESLSDAMLDALAILGPPNDEDTSLNARLRQRRRERSQAATKVNRRVALGLPAFVRGSEERAQYRTKNMTASEAYDLGIVTKDDLAKRWERLAAAQVMEPRYGDRS